jgi:hypothetical protein
MDEDTEQPESDAQGASCYSCDFSSTVKASTYDIHTTTRAEREPLDVTSALSQGSMLVQ